MPSVEDSAIFPTLSSSVILSGAAANRAQSKDPVLTTHLAHRNKGFPRLRCASLGMTAYLSMIGYHPTFCPLFCSSSHCFSGAKYSSSAPASI